ncbi:PREDICTED: protein SSX2-like, partial [Bison bison bison]|uniref:Protein SSX2-like n=1 Tax=Bison bison bison TaxID=43346 RepID=A0A6P3J3J8_BISBB
IKLANCSDLLIVLGRLNCGISSRHLVGFRPDVERHFGTASRLRLFVKKQILCIILGLQCTPPAFMCPKNGATKSKRCDSKTKNPREKGSKKKKVSAIRLRERKPVAYEEISDPEEESNGNTVDVWANRRQKREPVAQEEISDHEEESNRNTVNVWANRLRKRKPVAYEEISDPEEEEDEDD